MAFTRSSLPEHVRGTSLTNGRGSWVVGRGYKSWVVGVGVGVGVGVLLYKQMKGYYLKGNEADVSGVAPSRQSE